MIFLQKKYQVILTASVVIAIIIGIGIFVVTGPKPVESEAGNPAVLLSKMTPLKGIGFSLIKIRRVERLPEDHRSDLRHLGINPDEVEFTAVTGGRARATEIFLGSFDEENVKNKLQKRGFKEGSYKGVSYLQKEEHEVKNAVGFFPKAIAKAPVEQFKKIASAYGGSAKSWRDDKNLKKTLPEIKYEDYIEINNSTFDNSVDAESLRAKSVNPPKLDLQMLHFPSSKENAREIAAAVEDRLKRAWKFDNLSVAVDGRMVEAIARGASPKENIRPRLKFQAENAKLVRSS